jgi:hypothetical protein
MKNGNAATANVATTATATTAVNFNGFISTVDFHNREHFRSNGNVRLERDRINGRLIFHVFDCGSLILVRERMSTENVETGWFHAFGQRIPDAAALPMGAGARAKYDAMQPLVDHYNSGATTWNLERDGASGDTILVEALMRETVLDKNGKKVERDRTHVAKYVGELSRTERDKMVNSKRLRAIVDAIRSERNAGINEDELFEGLDDLDV